MTRTTALVGPHSIPAALLLATLIATGCNGPTSSGEGPGGRAEQLALTPDQEYVLGQKAFAEVLRKSHPLPKTGPEVQFVTAVGQRIVGTLKNELLLKEIHLVHVNDFRWEWEFTVLRDDQINAFCLPGGRVAVYTGLLQLIGHNESKLATVMGHEIAHALAHHASERIAREHMHEKAMAAMHGVLGDSPLIGVLAAGTQVNSLKYDRQQESEADHIGIFLMTFAGYDPEEAEVFWQQMQRATGSHGRPEILSDHPSDAHRIAAIRGWIDRAKAAKKAFDEGRVAK